MLMYSRDRAGGFGFPSLSHRIAGRLEDVHGKDYGKEERKATRWDARAVNALKQRGT